MMKTTRVSALMIVASLAMVLTAGCTEVSRQMGSLTQDKYAKPRSGSVWIVPPPQLEPPGGADRVVYISYRNISDAEIDLYNLLRDAAQQQGWTITNDPSAARYRLRVSTRFFGEVDPESGGASVGRALGGITGAAVGIGTGRALARASDSRTAGAVGGTVAGSLVAAGMMNASRPREWALIMDAVLEEYHDTPVEFVMNRDDASGTRDVAGASNARMAAGGGTTAANVSTATAVRESNYFPHGVRLSVWANQMNMQEAEAMPEILDRAKRVVTQMLPM